LRKRILSFLMVLSLVGAVLAGCGGGKQSGGSDENTSSGVIELEFWNGFTGPDGEGMQKLVDQFNQEYAGKIRVKMQRLPWGEFYDKIVTAVASGKAPDGASWRWITSSVMPSGA